MKTPKPQKPDLDKLDTDIIKGHQSFYDGSRREDNPYFHTTHNYIMWEMGWDYADRINNMYKFMLNRMKYYESIDVL